MNTKKELKLNLSHLNNDAFKIVDAELNSLKELVFVFSDKSLDWKNWQTIAVYNLANSISLKTENTNNDFYIDKLELEEFRLNYTEEEISFAVWDLYQNWALDTLKESANELDLDYHYDGSELPSVLKVLKSLDGNDEQYLLNTLDGALND